MPRSASSGSGRARARRASPPTSASRPRTSTRSRRRTTTSWSTRTTTSPASCPSCASSRTSTRSRRCSSRSTSPPTGSTTSSRTSPASSSTLAASGSWRASSTSARAATATAVGYDTIAASGPHACYLHWTRNDGAVVPGDLILIDAGVEVDSLYTADITRTIPVSGRFTEVQRRVYETVREAADAAFAAARPGVEVPRPCTRRRMQVIAHRVAEWGLLPVTAEEALDAGHGRPPPPVHGPRHEPPPRHRRARLRAGAPRDVLRRHCSSRAWSSRSSPACTSRSTTSPCPRSTAASACASRTTS